MLNTVARRRFAMLVLAAASTALAGCEVDKKNLLAPTDAFIALRSDSPFVAANTTTTITIEVRKVDGTAAPDGTEVVLAATAGELDQKKIRTKAGQSTVGYRATATGTARITASSGSLSADLSLRVGSAAPGSVNLFATPALLPPEGGEVEILATVSAPNGNLVIGAPVTFTTSAGTVSSTEAVTNDKGEARTTLRTSSTAMVRAAVLGLESSTQVRVRLATSIRFTASPAAPVVGSAATLAATFTTSDGEAAAGRVRFLLGDGQVRDMGNISGSASTTYTWNSEGGYNVSAEFTDGDGFVTRETIRVNVQAKPAPTPTPTPTPTPNPTPNPTPTPTPGAGTDELDLSQVTFLHTDISRWAITSRLTNVSIRSDSICLDHTKAGRWPVTLMETAEVEGNPWIIANINGRWYAATYDWLRPGQICKGVTAQELGVDQIRIPPMDRSWPGPRSGDLVGFMVSARARDRLQTVEERTQVVMVRWP
jgi:hypothetical protein